VAVNRLPLTAEIRARFQDNVFKMWEVKVALGQGLFAVR